MYGTCLFCSARLGRNESIEAFQVGRRLAFDAHLGRLWVVCRGCGRWNLSPLEERWEAIEECERRYHDTRVRVSTEQIGLARLPDGLELVRIGRPLRPEFAAWRYGDRFGRRRRKALLTAGLGITGAAAFFLGGAVGGSFFSAFMLWQVGKAAVQGDPNKVVARVEAGGERIKVKREQLKRVRLLPQEDTGFGVAVPVKKRTVEVYGPEALRALSLLLPPANRFGGNREQVQDAVRHIERSHHPDRYLGDVARSNVTLGRGLSEIPATVRLALEMAAHEEGERRALEGELEELERAWQEAEEIAAISDSLLLPAGIGERLRRLRGG